LAENVPISGVEYLLSGATLIMTGLFVLPILFKSFNYGRTKQYTYIEKELSHDDKQPFLKNRYDNYNTEVVNKAFISEV